MLSKGNPMILPKKNLEFSDLLALVQENILNLRCIVSVFPHTIQSSNLVLRIEKMEEKFKRDIEILEQIEKILLDKEIQYKIEGF